MLPWSPIEYLLMLAGFLLGIAAVAAAIFGRHRSEPTVEDYGFASWKMSILIAMIIFLLFRAAFAPSAPFFISGDEYIRLHYSIDWSVNPYFAPVDHIWLAGQFYVLGLMTKLIGAPHFSMTLTSLAGTLALVFFAGDLARRTWRSHFAGTAAAILTGTHFMVLWSAVNPVAEVFFLPLLLGAIDFFVRGMQRPPGDRSTDRDYLMAAFLIGLGNAFRYEMWYAGIVFAVFLGLRTVWMIFIPPMRRCAWQPALGMGLIAAFPAAWFTSSTLRYGSPFGFLKDHIGMNEQTNMFYDHANPVSAFFDYPRILWNDNKMWIPLALIVGAGLALKRWRSKSMPVVLAWVAVLLCGMIVSIKAGIGSNTRMRFTMFLIVPLIAMGSGTLGILWDTIERRGARWAARAIVIAYLALMGWFSLVRAVAYYPNWFNERPELLALITRMQRERDSSRAALQFNYLHPPGRRVCFYFESPTLQLLARAHTPEPTAIYQVYNDWDLFLYIEEAQAGDTVIARKKDNGPTIGHPRAQMIEDLGLFELWRIQ